MANLPKIFTDRQARENFKDKVEVVMAVIVLTQFAYSKIKKEKDDGYVDISSLPKEK